MNEQIKRLIKQGENNKSITLMTGASYATINNLRNELNFVRKIKKNK